MGRITEKLKEKYHLTPIIAFTIFVIALTIIALIVSVN